MEAPMPPLTAKQIKMLRQRHGWNQSELATFLQVSRCSVSRWENGRKGPRGLVLRQLWVLERMPAFRSAAVRPS